MTETRESTETGGYASLEEDEEELSPGPEHPSDSDYTLSEPDSDEDEEEEEEEEETTDDPEYDPGYKVKQRLGGGRGAPSRRAPRVAAPPGPPPQPCALCGRPPPGEGAAAPGGPPCRLCRPAAPQATPSARIAAQRQVGDEEDEEEDEDEGATSTGGDGPPGDEGGAYHCTECEDSFDDLGELHGHFMLHARGEV
ncbi:zinc finger protein 428 [Vombatus ursinus]|uniref:Zinc finger protein 428 n=1 Tax=Vombatus ursinus TaxID=29139 RepID=A0A4X2KHR6_VOMUR|nr:zinc finger protein 428 [Vombatus ursinus]XP_027714009.1 zinc finger protein 428 [Vombatus ursinus]XP_027714011.1 zinc finger protein 428 [Vombatus ursinus]